jgi:hypothetical protein
MTARRAQYTTMSNMGKPCIAEPEHGPSLVLQSGREWCPDHAHDGQAGSKPTTPFLDKQQAALDALTAESQSA